MLNSKRSRGPQTLRFITMLDQILLPVSAEEFFQTYWTKDFLHVCGQSDKFAHLFPWTVLNQALEEHRFEGHRLRLFKSGAKIAADRYMNGLYVNSGNLTSELSNGATLIFDSCDEVHPPLRALCVCLEKLFHRRVTANLYAGWRFDNGFDVHWDTQDVLILQVAGRKRWKIWPPTRNHPFRQDVVDTSPATRPAGEPFWDAILEPGGLLSIPRGWWHVAIPVDEPCLHLTVTIKSLNGIDLLHWLADHMKNSEIARMELPLLATQEQRLDWLTRLQTDLVAAFDAKVMDRYLRDMDAKALPRPRLALPVEADSRRNSLNRDTALELAVAHPIHFANRGKNDTRVVCRAAGFEWQVDSDVSEKLGLFNDGKPHTMDELAPRPDIRVSAMIGLLVMKGVLRRVLPS